MIYAFPFALQGLILFGDELLCHHRRALRPWERWGHALDTLSFVGALAMTLWLTPTAAHLQIYAAVSALSCLLVTKDEWQHAELCSGFEHWLHALLFMLHPTLLIWAAYLWVNDMGTSARLVALGTGSIVFIYQLTYWNVWRRDQ